MKSGHIIYKVHDLEQAVKAWQEQGFQVEYGRVENPINALIYFSQGPYIELLKTTGFPKLFYQVFKFFGLGKKVARFNYWDTCKEGICGFCIEKQTGTLDSEIAFLKKHGIKGLYLKRLKRVDVHQRVLNYQCFFPQEIHFPFLMRYFEVDPKPLNLVHPNGVKRIKHIIYKINQQQAELLKQLVDDASLIIEVGSVTIPVIEYEYE